MRRIYSILALFFVLICTDQTSAQSLTSNNTYWQIAPRFGADFPTYSHNMKYIDYRGDVTGGISINKYWNGWGFQVDGDFIKNDVKMKDLPHRYYVVPSSSGRDLTGEFEKITTKKNDITRFFVGVGPAYAYVNPANNFSIDVAAMGGLGIVKGGDIYTEGEYTDKSPLKMPLVYHSGYDHKGFAAKGSLRLNYFFIPSVGIHAGAYYINHFKLTESKSRSIAEEMNPSMSKLYAYEIGETDIVVANTKKVRRVFSEKEALVRTIDAKDQPSFKLSSFGAFAGLTFRLGFGRKKVYTNPRSEDRKVCKVSITAKDEKSQQVVPNTSIAILDTKGNIVESGITNEFGVVTFATLQPGNYTVKGKFADINLKGTVISSTDFSESIKYDGNIRKEVLYTDNQFIVKGKVLLCNTSNGVGGVAVVLKNRLNGVVKNTLSNSTGEFMFHVQQNSSYNIHGKKDSYFSQTQNISTKDFDRNNTLFITLEVCMEEVNCDKSIRLENILYDLGKFYIREDAKPELNRLVQFMQDNPAAKVELSSHTDSRASREYNKALSQNRAKAAVDYIVSQGIDKNRLIAVGYGEDKLLNKCTDGVECSEEEHQLNRRTEFRIICP